ncbi:NFX1-type zinc finger-containing protein 1 [Lunasporangiospora selenospora]|uniref:NFX1-type zinc finger-containing protein 1 n=1 Tax=Lunasporangiospora selenospora TaxID=979761 RepID=A0A9P6G3S8_9FUNG|nr:NFX1-type zinc finger-containing protein 1 [Lunasporangiospora selenospora]
MMRRTDARIKDETVIVRKYQSLGIHNFRGTSVFPTITDIEEEDYPEPPENAWHRAYGSTEEYLKTHFHLLRADCMLPIRDAIRAYQSGTVDENDMMIYIRVHLVSLLFTGVGLVHRMSFLVDGCRVNWRQTKRLIPGTLVCLSTDDFKHYRFATVVERDIDLLSDPRDLRIGIMFQDNNPELDFNPDIRYVMIESMQGYFEAYRHVLKCLQEINPATLPFQKHLVELCPDLEPPPYSRSNPNFENPDCLAKSTKSLVAHLKGDAKAHLKCKDNKEPDTVEIEEDPIQPNVAEAMDRLLRRELAIVQGPPGTGKTFLGLLTAHMMLEYCHLKTTNPIIVICQTNHALDQFLEGVMKFEERVIRVGSRSKSPTVSEITLYKTRVHYKENPADAHRDGVKLTLPIKFYKLKDSLERDMQKLVEEMATEYVALSKLLELNIITVTQCDSFADDEWITGATQNDEEPTVQSWLQAVPHAFDPNAISAFDDTLLKEDFVPEIDEEELEERVDEFMVGNIEETKIFGTNVDLKETIVCHLNDVAVGDVTQFLGMPNVHDIPVNKRLGVYKVWLKQYHASIEKQLGELHARLRLVCENIQRQRRLNDVEILKTARVIGMTTTAASKYHEQLCLIRPKIMICEEASEALEAHLTCALTPTIEHFLLIGDHEQLRPSMSVNDLSEKGINISMFERLVLNRFPYTMLDCQRRMRPEISRLVRPIYKTLTDHNSVRQFDSIRGMVNNLWFLTHDEPDMLGPNNSHVNMHEVNIAARLATYLIQQDYSPSQITILTMYSGQRNKIMERLRQAPLHGPEMIRVSTVDGYQGEENDIIILSLVRSNTKNSIGFLKTSNRVCVALSRARKGLYIVGNAKLMMEQSKLWAVIIRGLFHENPESIKSSFPENPQHFRIGNRIQLRCQRHPHMVSSVGIEADFDHVQDVTIACAALFAKYKRNPARLQAPPFHQKEEKEIANYDNDGDKIEAFGTSDEMSKTFGTFVFNKPRSPFNIPDSAQ